MSKVANFQLPYLHLTIVPAFGVSIGVTTFEFCRDFRYQKTRESLGYHVALWRDPTFSCFSKNTNLWPTDRQTHNDS